MDTGDNNDDGEANDGEGNGDGVDEGVAEVDRDGDDGELDRSAILAKYVICHNMIINVLVI